MLRKIYINSRLGHHNYNAHSLPCLTVSFIHVWPANLWAWWFFFFMFILKLGFISDLKKGLRQLQTWVFFFGHFISVSSYQREDKYLSLWQLKNWIVLEDTTAFIYSETIPGKTAPCNDLFRPRKNSLLSNTVITWKGKAVKSAWPLMDDGSSFRLDNHLFIITC